MKRSVMVIITLIMSLTICHPLLASSEKRTLLIYETQKEKDQIMPVIQACGIKINAVDTTEFMQATAKEHNVFEKYDYIVLTTPKVFAEVVTYGKNLFCIGPGFYNIEGMHVKALNNSDVEISFDTLTQTSKFIPQLTVIDGYEGEAFGRINLSFERTYPFGVKLGKVSYVPYVESHDLTSFALGQILKDYFGEARQAKCYVKIDEVYPFSNFSILCEMADTFYKNGIPFVVSAMPVYEHTDYPAFKKYTQVLRYMQSRGGCIVLNAPVEDLKEPINESIESKLERAKIAFEQEGVVLRHFDAEPYEITFDEFKNIKNRNKQFPTLNMDLAITYPIPETREEVQVVVQEVNGKWLRIDDLEKSFSNNHDVFNEQKIVEDSSVYHKKIDVKFKNLFKAGNKILMVVVLVSISIFGIIITIGRNLYRKKFYKKK